MSMLKIDTFDFVIPAKVLEYARTLEAKSIGQRRVEGCIPVLFYVEYMCPDHPAIIDKPFMNVEIDEADGLPIICKRLEHWRTKLDTKLKLVRVIPQVEFEVPLSLAISKIVMQNSASAQKYMN